MILQNDNRSLCNCSQSAIISWCAIIYCNYKAQNNRRFQLSKDTSVRKDWIHAIGCQVDNLPSKIFICSDHFEENCFNPR